MVLEQDPARPREWRIRRHCRRRLKRPLVISGLGTNQNWIVWTKWSGRGHFDQVLLDCRHVENAAQLRATAERMIADPTRRIVCLDQPRLNARSVTETRCVDLRN